MSAEIIDGKQIAADIREELKTEVIALKEKGIIMSVPKKKPVRISAFFLTTTGYRQKPRRRNC